LKLNKGDGIVDHPSTSQIDEYCVMGWEGMKNDDEVVKFKL
jgi:hypothetical protein